MTGLTLRCAFFNSDFSRPMKHILWLNKGRNNSNGKAALPGNITAHAKKRKKIFDKLLQKGGSFKQEVRTVSHKHTSHIHLITSTVCACGCLFTWVCCAAEVSPFIIAQLVQYMREMYVSQLSLHVTSPQAKQHLLCSSLDIVSLQATWQPNASWWTHIFVLSAKYWSWQAHACCLCRGCGFCIGWRTSDTASNSCLTKTGRGFQQWKCYPRCSCDYCLWNHRYPRRLRIKHQLTVLSAFNPLFDLCVVRGEESKENTTSHSPEKNIYCLKYMQGLCY